MSISWKLLPKIEDEEVLELEEEDPLDEEEEIEEEKPIKADRLAFINSYRLAKAIKR